MFKARQNLFHSWHTTQPNPEHDRQTESWRVVFISPSLPFLLPLRLLQSLANFLSAPDLFCGHLLPWALFHLPANLPLFSEPEFSQDWVKSCAFFSRLTIKLTSCPSVMFFSSASVQQNDPWKLGLFTPCSYPCLGLPRETTSLTHMHTI